ncbi:3-oxoadipate CoA-transferase subunit A [Primorskyibacter flagellatus]|uniref:3-oxoadipate CoA-transferase subunit A n=1 Tax=Primorskyibacter flagellatus TaxID=1387277 RepID=A0A917AFQ5_9RHOB|nr:3-oxoacid CoA-transferase subunit A [Primorskyibacter flagellatus]GGE50156.1 3-oxoadipate CoA-transferase subunit A [Primorskyibacter flagellatus]
MIDKRVASLTEALEGIGDGATVMIGGFGAVGQPDALVDALAEIGPRDLTIIANNAGWSAETGISHLMARGLVRKMICSFPKGSEVFKSLYTAGKIELEIVPQGTLAERIRCGGAGIPAFFTATGYQTKLSESKETREFDGRHYVMERSLTADVALVEAWKADRWGNLIYRGSSRNFNPIMSMAAQLTIAQASEIVDGDGLEPNAVVTPGIFVNRVVQVESRVDDLLRAQKAS